MKFAKLFLPVALALMVVGCSSDDKEASGIPETLKMDGEGNPVIVMLEGDLCSVTSVEMEGVEFPIYVARENAMKRLGWLTMSISPNQIIFRGDYNYFAPRGCEVKIKYKGEPYQISITQEYKKWVSPFPPGEVVGDAVDMVMPRPAYPCFNSKGGTLTIETEGYMCISRIILDGTGIGENLLKGKLPHFFGPNKAENYTGTFDWLTVEADGKTVTVTVDEHKGYGIRSFYIELVMGDSGSVIRGYQSPLP